MPIDTWRQKLKNSAPNRNVLLLRCEDIDRAVNPVLFSMVESYVEFYGWYSKTNENYKTAYIYDNPAFLMGPHDGTGNTVTIKNLGFRANEETKLKLRELKYNLCFNGTRFKTRDELTRDGIYLSPTAWFKLQLAIVNSGRRIKNSATGQRITTEIAQFFSKVKKGSRGFHKIIRNHYYNSSQLPEEQIVKTFCRLTATVPLPVNDYDEINIEPERDLDEPVPPNGIPIKHIEKGLGLWNNFFFPNDLREFILKSRFNSLWTNDRLHAAGLRENPWCTFCSIVTGQTLNKESFSHLFTTCTTTTNLLTTIATDMGVNLDIRSEDFKKLYWYGERGGGGNKKTDTAWLLFWEVFRFRIWYYRGIRRVPNVVRVKNEILFALNNIAGLSKKWYIKLTGNDFAIELINNPG